MNDIKWLKSKAVRLIPYIRERLIETQFDEDALVEIIAEFVRQPTIVRCKDCKKRYTEECGLRLTYMTQDDMFDCAAGRNKDGETKENSESCS